LKLAQAHIDLVTVSAGLIVDRNAFFYAMPPYFRPRGVNVPLAREIKRCPEIRIPVSVVAESRWILAEEIIAEGSADMVAIARALHADPDMLKKVLARGGGHSPSVPPLLGLRRAGPRPVRRQSTVGPDRQIQRVPRRMSKKKVVVIGGGVAGTQAARTLTERGMRWCCSKKKDSLGGLLTDISRLPYKDDMARYTTGLSKPPCAAAPTSGSERGHAGKGPGREARRHRCRRRRLAGEAADSGPGRSQRG
jgi:hypothetical protein